MTHDDTTRDGPRGRGTPSSRAIFAGGSSQRRLSRRLHIPLAPARRNGRLTWQNILRDHVNTWARPACVRSAGSSNGWTPRRVRIPSACSCWPRRKRPPARPSDRLRGSAGRRGSSPSPAARRGRPAGHQAFQEATCEPLFLMAVRCIVIGATCRASEWIMLGAGRGSHQ